MRHPLLRAGLRVRAPFAFLLASCLLGSLFAARVDEPDPDRFELTVLTRALDRPMELTVAPDGRVLWIELAGRLRIYQPRTGEVIEAGALEVFAEQENGLLGLALDPDFERNQRLYLLYSPPDYPGQHLSRFTLDGDRLDLASEQVLLTFEEQRRECCHHAGSLQFGADGLLFIATGDNTHPGGDAQGFAPLDEREDRYPFDAQKGPSNTQSLSGKILRLRPTEDGYEIPPGNLFSDPAAGRPEIYVMGCRNPWRIGVDQRTGFVYWGEVGPDAGGDGERGPRGYDEINQARAAGNFGWPYFIADNQPYRDVDFATGDVGAAFDPEHPSNRSPNNTGALDLPPAQPAWIYYPYGDSERFPELDAPGGRTACAGPVYDFDPALDSDTKFPRHYDRCLFAFEWSRHWIQAIHLDEDSNIERIERLLPARTFKRPIDLEFGPQGALYMLEYGTTWGVNEDAALVRIDYRSGNRAPRPRVTIAGNVGAAPLVVQPSSEGTYDPDGDVLSYSWRLPPALEVLSTERDPRLTFAREGSFNLELTVSDPSGASATTVVPVLVGNTRPQVSFDRPRDGGFLQGEEAIDWFVRVQDAEDGDSAEDPLDLMEHVAVEVAFHPGAPPGSGGEASDQRHPGLQAMGRSDCFNCHAIDRRIVGPALIEIAERYRDDDAALAACSERVALGSSGIWGEVPMLPHPHEDALQLRQMVDWVLSLESAAPALEVQRGLHGLVPQGNEGGSWVLSATYTDAGGEGVGPLTGMALVRLRHPAVEAEHFTSGSGNQILSSASASGGAFVGAINAGSHLRYGAVDLDGIDRVALRVSSAGAGGFIELRADGVDGALLARVEVLPNGAWESWYELVLPLQDPGGLHDLFVLFGNVNGGGGLMNLDRLLFLRPDERAAPVELPPVATTEVLSPAGASLFAERDGQRIHVWEKAPAGWQDLPVSERRAVVFVHGATWSGRPDFDLEIRDYSVMEHFRSHGWAAYAVDVQGYGASDDPVGENWSEAEDAALDLAAAVEFICAHAGVERVSLLGWSWGCQISGRYAQLQPERVSRLVLQGGHYRIKYSPEAPQEKFRSNDAEGAASDFIEGCYEEDVVARYVQECLRHDPVTPNGVLRDFTLGSTALLEPAQLSLPILMIFGEHELHEGRLADACEFFQELASPDKRLAVLPGGGHAILLEKPHLLWQNEVRRFFEQE